MGIDHRTALPNTDPALLTDEERTAEVAQLNLKPNPQPAPTAAAPGQHLAIQQARADAIATAEWLVRELWLLYRMFTFTPPENPALALEGSYSQELVMTAGAKADDVASQLAGFAEDVMKSDEERRADRRDQALQFAVRNPVVWNELILLYGSQGVDLAEKVYEYQWTIETTAWGWFEFSGWYGWEFYINHEHGTIQFELDDDPKQSAKNLYHALKFALTGDDAPVRDPSARFTVLNSGSGPRASNKNRDAHGGAQRFVPHLAARGKEIAVDAVFEVASGPLPFVLVGAVDKANDLRKFRKAHNLQKARRWFQLASGGRVVKISKPVAEAFRKIDGPLLKTFDNLPSSQQLKILGKLRHAKTTQAAEAMLKKALGNAASSLRRVDPKLVVNALSKFNGRNFLIKGQTLLLDKKGLKHILERHHPQYWNGSIKGTQSFFAKKTSISEIESAVFEVLKQNRDQVAKIGVNSKGQMTGIVNGIKYRLGLKKGRLQQFYPVLD